jgi:hypothetical protein
MSLRACQTAQGLILWVGACIFFEGVYLERVTSDTQPSAMIYDGLAAMCVVAFALFGGILPLRRHVRDDVTDLKLEVYKRIQELTTTKLLPCNSDSETAYLLIAMDEDDALIVRVSWADYWANSLDGSRHYRIKPDGRVYRGVRRDGCRADQAWLTRPLCRCRLEYILQALQEYSPRYALSR